MTEGKGLWERLQGPLPPGVWTALPVLLMGAELLGSIAIVLKVPCE
jgi:hypothetical protein